MTSDVLGGGDDADGGDDALGGADGGDEDGGDDDDGGLEIVGMADNVAYLAPVLRMLALLHTFTAIAMMIGYYCLKVRPCVSILIFITCFCACAVLFVCLSYVLWYLLTEKSLMKYDYVCSRYKLFIICSTGSRTADICSLISTFLRLPFEACFSQELLWMLLTEVTRSRNVLMKEFMVIFSQFLTP